MNKKNICLVVVCYAHLPVVQQAINSILLSYPPDYPIVIVDNHSLDGAARKYIWKLADTMPNIETIDPGQNLGCHRGFNFGFRHAIERYDPLVLIKHDDDMLAPQEPQWIEEVVSFFQHQANVVFAGTDFFQDGRLINNEQTVVQHGQFSTRWAPWHDVPNLPVGFLRRDFFETIGGLHPPYKIVEQENRLYGEEEIRLAQKATELGGTYGYFLDLHAAYIDPHDLDPDYVLWKYAYGYLGTYQYDYSRFKKDKEALRSGYRHWLENSDNELHRFWASRYFQRE